MSFRYYTTPSGTVTIPAGRGTPSSLVPITIDINGDTISEDTETFRIRLLDTSDITLHGDRTTATVMIEDDVPTLSFVGGGNGDGTVSDQSYSVGNTVALALPRWRTPSAMVSVPTWNMHSTPPCLPA